MAKLIRTLPDGGWGWMVVFGAALANMVNQALLSVFGLLYGQAIGSVSGMQGAAVVMNVSVMVSNFTGLIVGPLLKNYSARVVTCAGVILTSAGLTLSSVATTLPHFLITYSVFTGLGLGLIMPATFMAVNSYFDRRKGHAVGLAMAGTGIGQTMMPQVVSLLFAKYDFQGTVLIMGALSLHGLVGALLFQPVQWHLKTLGDEEQESVMLLAKNKDEEEVHLERIENSQEENGSKNSQANEKDKGGTMMMMLLGKIVSTMDLALLKDPIFVHIVIGLSIVHTSSIAFTMVFPFHLRDMGLRLEKVALCMSALSGADIVARLTIPRLAARLRVGYRITFLFGALMLALCRALLSVQTTLATILATAALCGYVRAATVINQNLTISEYCCRDESRLPSALGLCMVTKGTVVLTLGQLLGWLRDYTGSYVVCIQIQAACTLLVAVTWGIEILHRRLTSSPQTS